MKPRTRTLAFAALLALAAASASRAEIDGPREYVYERVGRSALKVFVFRPDASAAQAPRAGVLLFHGGGWNLGSAAWSFEMAQHFAALGLVALAIDYRLSDADATPVEALDDTCAAFRWTREHAANLHLDPQRLAAFGESAGGQLAAAAATVGCPPAAPEEPGGAPDALLLWSAAVDVADMFWFRKQLRDRAPALDYSPLQHVDAKLPPTLLVHGKQDSITPYAGAEAFCHRAAALGRRCELHGYEGLGHLLSRKLAEQDKTFDIDPVAAADGVARIDRFLQALGYLDSRTAQR